MQKKSGIVLGIVAFVTIFFMYSVYYGFSFTFPPCIYTEKDIPLPPELQGATLVVDSREGTYIFEGSGVEGLACSETLGLVARSIVNGQDTRAVYTNQYKAREMGPIQGKKLTLERIVASTKHGISTIDSGSGPIHWLVVGDENGIKYRLGAAYLGLNAKDSFLSVWKENKKIGMLVYDILTDTVAVDTGLEK